MKIVQNIDSELKQGNPDLSIIVPVYNERTMLPLFLETISPVIASIGILTELLFVDDGSEDGSASFLTQHISRTENLRLIKLSRNFGKEAAITAGIEHALGEAVIVMDADLQDPPEEIPRMVECWRSGADVVLMQRRSRKGESIFKRFSAYCFYRLLNHMCRTEIPVDTGDFRLMSRRAVNALLQLKERNRYMKGLFAWIGMPTQVLHYDRATRAAGETSWDYFGLLGLAFEGLTSFSITPLRWAIGVGALSASIGALFGLWIVLKTILIGEIAHGYPSLVAFISFLGGIQLLSIGVLGEYVGKTYIESKQRPVYLIEDIIESGRNIVKSPSHIQRDSRNVEAV